MGELGALFNPGMRHEIEERESKQNSREEEGNARDGDLRIDLASGVAVINIPARVAGNADGGHNDEPSVKGSRTVGEKPAQSGTVRSSHPRAEQRRATSGRRTPPKDHPAAIPADPTRGAPEKADTRRPSPAPSSKASRAAR